MATDPRPARTKAALISAAQDVLAAGTSKVSVAQLTSAAGVAQGSFYNHFGSREELFLEAAVAARFDAGLDEVVAHAKTIELPGLRFLFVLKNSMLLPITNPRVANILINAGHSLHPKMFEAIAERYGLTYESFGTNTAGAVIIQSSLHAFLVGMLDGTFSEADVPEFLGSYALLLGLPEEALSTLD